MITLTRSIAARAYKQAMSTLSTLNDIPYSQAHDRPNNGYPITGYTNNIFSSLLPNIQGQGPIASAMRIALKLRHQHWLPESIMNFISKEVGGGRRKDEELHGKAVKVIDLLQHAAELGNTDALFTLGQISLVRWNCFFFSLICSNACQ